MSKMKKEPNPEVLVLQFQISLLLDLITQKEFAGRDFSHPHILEVVWEKGNRQ